MWSARSVLLNRWATKTVVLLRVPFSSASQMAASVFASRLLVASSSKSTPGLRVKALARARRKRTTVFGGYRVEERHEAQSVVRKQQGLRVTIIESERVFADDMVLEVLPPQTPR